MPLATGPGVAGQVLRPPLPPKHVTAPSGDERMPLAGRIVMGFLFVSGSAITLGGLLAWIRDDEGMGLFILGLVFLAVPVAILWLRRKIGTDSISLSSPPLSATKRIGFIIYDNEGKIAGGWLIRLFRTFFARMIFFASISVLLGLGTPNHAFFVVCAVLIGFVGLEFYLSRGSKKWRAGRRTCRGILWDLVKREGSEGRFSIEFNPRPEAGSSLTAVRRYVVLNITPCAGTPSQPIQLRGPELVITLVRKRTGSHCRVGAVTFCGRNCCRLWDSGMNAGMIELHILHDDRLTRMEFGETVAGLELIERLGKLGRILGTRAAVRVLISGGQNGPPEDGLTRVADEFGWTIDASG